MRSESEMTREDIIRMAREAGFAIGCVPDEIYEFAELVAAAALAEDAMQRLTDVQQEIDCYGDGNVYRGQRSSDSKMPTLTINGMPANQNYLNGYCVGRTDLEPVAFIHKNFERRIREVLTEADFGGDKLAFLTYCMSDGNLLPLYPAPPKRKPLKDEEIEQCMKHAYATANGRNLEHAFARAIERAHGIGGEE